MIASKNTINSTHYGVINNEKTIIRVQLLLLLAQK